MINLLFISSLIAISGISTSLINFESSNEAKKH